MNQQQQIQFWKDLAGCIAGTRTIAAALDMLLAKKANAYPEELVQELAREVRSGRGLSEVVASRPEHFPPAIAAMVAAGVAGGTPDLAACLISEGAAETSLLPLPPTADLDAGLRWLWGSLSRMLAAGVPLGRSLEILAEGASRGQIREACRAMAQAAAEHRPVSQVMRQYSDLFHDRVIGLIEAGEQQGALDTAAAEAAKLASPLASSTRHEGEHKVDLTTMPEPLADKIVTSILMQSIKDNASDIHFQPETGGAMFIRYRIDGVLYEMQPPPAEVVPALIARLKVMAGLDVSVTNIPQDGRIMVDAGEQHVDLRVSVMPTLWGERIVLRLLRQSPAVPFAFEPIGLGGQRLEQMHALCRLPRGLLLLAGPAGCGKTTTMYSMVESLNKPDRAIITIEDPVECAFQGISQVQVNLSAGVTFAQAMRTALKQSPNIIVVGELRDRESAVLAIQCAMVGHLVIAGSPADGPISAIRQLIDLGVDAHLLASALGGVISQRLIRRLCPECRKPNEAGAQEAWMEPFTRARPDAAFWRPAGCRNCGMSGFRGRTGVFSILSVDESLRSVVASSDLTTGSHPALVQNGLSDLLQDALDKAAAGITSLDEVMRVQADCLL